MNPIKITDLFDLKDLQDHIEGGWVSSRPHPELPYAVLNYTPKTQYSNDMWNDVTMQCRGLVYDTETLEVVSRPLKKFYNHGQPGCAYIPLNAPVSVTDKADGSMIAIAVDKYGNEIISSRGSFISTQAKSAKELLKNYRYNFVHGITYIFELIGPSNRIVLDYPKDELVLLCTVVNKTGQIYSADEETFYWSGPKTEQFQYFNLATALAAPPRNNAEGFVIRDLNTGAMLKLKQEDYCRLHKLVFGLSEISIWEHLSTHNGDYTGLLETLPDEFHSYVRGVAEDLLRKYHELCEAVEHQFNYHYNDLKKHGIEDSRAVYARVFTLYDRPLNFLLFMHLDNKDYGPAVWKFLRPKGDAPNV